MPSAYSVTITLFDTHVTFELTRLFFVFMYSLIAKWKKQGCTYTRAETNVQSRDAFQKRGI